MQNPYADMAKIWGEFKAPQLPAFDVSTAVAFGRRNAEAANSISQLWIESAQAISRRQAELARNHVENLHKTARELISSGSPEINANRYVEYTKNAFETSLNDLREITELATKSNFEAFDVINRRATESLDELTSFGKQAVNKAKKAA